MKVYLLLFTVIFLSGCFLKMSRDQTNDFIFKIEEIPVFVDEFIYNLKRNNYGEDSVIAEYEIMEYLNLYVNFKLKVHEARQLGLDTTESFRSEYEKYINQLTESFMKDDSIIDVLAREAYNHLQYEINASHILIKVENPFNPADTLRAYKKIYQVYKMAIDGKDFQKLAIEFSEDPSAIGNRGNLGYFTGLQMVYPFEKAAYSTEVGSISSPFKTRFGYHILKVNDRRPSQGKVEVAHILLRHDPVSSSMDSLKLKNQIEEIHDSLKSGGDWNYFCQKYSQDQNTKNTGGRLRPFETGRVVPSFSETAFSLQEPGEFSEPVLTPYGWHIIKLINKIPLQTFDDLREDLKTRIKRDSRSEISQKLIVKKLKAENSFTINQNVKSKMLQYADSTLLTSQWAYDTNGIFLDSVIFSIGEYSYTVGQFFEYVKSNQKPVRNMEPGFYFAQLFSEFSDEEIIRYEKNHLAEKYFDYRMLSKEYEEGILLFEIMEMNIWSYAIQDSTGLEEFYQQNKDNYQWDSRLDAVIFQSEDIGLINEIRKSLKETYYYLSDDSISFTLDGEGIKVPDKDNQIDSLYRSASKNENWFLVCTSAAEMDQSQLLSFFQNKGYDTAAFIFRNGKSGANSIRIVSTSKKDLDKSINNKSGVNLHIESGIYQKGDNNFIDMIQWEAGIHDLSIEKDEIIIFVEKVIPPMDKRLDEVKGKVIADYQSYLEINWIQELRQKYDVQINHRALNNIIRKFEKL
jgi:peptidyl-prolyl cis-trans isomerase SurA